MSKIIIPIFFLCLNINTADNFQFISFEYKERIIENKKTIIVEGEVFFRLKDYFLVTYLTKPFKSLIRVKTNGDMEIYDFEKNTVLIENNLYTSSNQSYLWYFLSNNYSDMGLAKAGYVIKTSKIEDNFLVHYWVPKYNNNIKHILIAYDKNGLPTYQEIVSKNGEVKGKIYFTKYVNIKNVNFPSKIIDVFFNSKKDSVVSIKEYTNLKLDGQVKQNYFDFKIPNNAQIINK